MNLTSATAHKHTQSSLCNSAKERHCKGKHTKGVSKAAFVLVCVVWRTVVAGSPADVAYSIFTCLLDTRHGPVAATGTLICMRLLPTLLGAASAAVAAPAGGGGRRPGAQDGAARRNAALTFITSSYRCASACTLTHTHTLFVCVHASLCVSQSCTLYVHVAWGAHVCVCVCVSPQRAQ